MSTATGHGQATISSPRLERKYFIPTTMLAQATAMLSHSCIPDPQFPHGLVQSIYYDTTDLEFFYQSADGQRSKRKIRIRWYDRPNDGYTTAYLEVKSKVGLIGTKARSALQVQTSRLSRPTTAGPVPYDHLCQILTGLGFLPERRIYPIVMIQYVRSRFVDIATGMRVSLDQRTESRLITNLDGFVRPRVMLSGAIIELKGSCIDIPPTLQWLRHMQSDWSGYSKYAVCLEAHMTEPGSVGASMPSGRIEVS